MRRFFALAAAAAIASASSPAHSAQAAPPAGLAPQVRLEARRVVSELERIEAASVARPEKLRTADFTESELNAYIAYRLAGEGGDVLKELRFKLLAENRIEAMALVDLSKVSLPVFLRPQMRLFFAGRIDARSGHVRMDVDELFVEGQKVPTATLDLIVAAAAKFGLTDIVSLGDWYALPHGILEMRTAPGRLSLGYAP